MTQNRLFTQDWYEAKGRLDIAEPHDVGHWTSIDGLVKQIAYIESIEPDQNPPEKTTGGSSFTDILLPYMFLTERKSSSSMKAKPEKQLAYTITEKSHCLTMRKISISLCLGRNELSNKKRTAPLQSPADCGIIYLQFSRMRQHPKVKKRRCGVAAFCLAITPLAGCFSG